MSGNLITKKFNDLLNWADKQSWKRLAVVMLGSLFAIWIVPNVLSDLLFIAIIGVLLYAKFGPKAQQD